MKYNFDIPVNRRGTSSLKWDVAESELPMWVADMDFKTAPEVVQAVIKRASHGVFGYSVIDDEWYDAYIRWWQTRYGFEIEKKWLTFCTGVVPALSSIVRKLTTPAENVLVLTPCYNIFFNSIVNNGRNPLECPLEYEGGEYHINFTELESMLAMPQTSMMIFCNPHNPVGKIWDAETLGRVGELCRKHFVTLVSDEIHCDITAPGKKYTPFASVYPDCITCISPTKSFNLAGIQTAAVMIQNKNLRDKVRRALNTDEVAEPNAFAAVAAVAAYDLGGEWLDELREYIEENRRMTAQFIKDELPEIYLVPCEATYLLWLDCGKICYDASRLAKVIRRTTGLYLSEGGQYGTGGEKFLRMNIGCSHQTLIDGLERLRLGIQCYAN